MADMDGVRTLAAMRNADQLAAEVERLQTDNRRWQQRVEFAMADGDRLATWAISAQKDRDRLAAVIEQVRALCENTDTESAWGSPAVRADEVLELLPPATQPTQEATIPE